MTTSTRFILVIDTDTYSGNFEREMCAFITGQIGECGVGEDYIPEVEDLDKSYPQFNNAEILEWFEDNVRQVRDEHDCYRPCEIWPTPNRTNDGCGYHSDVSNNNPMQHPAYESVGIFLDCIPPEEMLEYIKLRVKDFILRRRTYGSEPKQLNVKGIRLLTETTKVKVVTETVEFVIDN